MSEAFKTKIIHDPFHIWCTVPQDKVTLCFAEFQLESILLNFSTMCMPVCKLPKPLCAPQLTKFCTTQCVVKLSDDTPAVLMCHIIKSKAIDYYTR